MNETELRRFAIYSDAKDYSTSTQSSSNISKFGVGSKQAGFYLGERIHVVTKSLELQGASLELSLDEKEMGERANEDVKFFILTNLTCCRSSKASIIAKPRD